MLEIQNRIATRESGLTAAFNRTEEMHRATKHQTTTSVVSPNRKSGSAAERAKTKGVAKFRPMTREGKVLPQPIPPPRHCGTAYTRLALPHPPRVPFPSGLAPELSIVLL